MAKLAECNTEDCHRGLEVGSVTDDDGNNHRQVRVKCNHCGVEGPWHVDDSLTRAIEDWNTNHVAKGAAVKAQKKADEADAAEAARTEQIAAFEQALAGYGPEIAFNQTKEALLRKAGLNEEAEYFKKTVVALKADKERIAAELAVLKARG